MVTKTSKANRVELKCAFGGTYRNRMGASQRKRMTSTRLSGCPFFLVVSAIQGSWGVRFIAPVDHNHETSPIQLIGLPEARKRSQEMKDAINYLGNAAVAPKRIQNAIQNQFPGALCTRKDISNDLAAMRLNKLNGRTPMELLISHLQSNDFVYHLLLEGSQTKSIFLIKVFPNLRRSSVLSWDGMEDAKIKLELIQWRLGRVAFHQDCRRCGGSLSRKHAVICSGAEDFLSSLTSIKHAH